MQKYGKLFQELNMPSTWSNWLGTQLNYEFWNHYKWIGFKYFYLNPNKFIVKSLIQITKSRHNHSLPLNFFFISLPSHQLSSCTHGLCLLAHELSPRHALGLWGCKTAWEEYLERPPLPTYPSRVVFDATPSSATFMIHFTKIWVNQMQHFAVYPSSQRSD